MMYMKFYITAEVVDSKMAICCLKILFYFV